jgi:8-oxo-dGTP pyrophosphatase MutT (NUDIX family)
VRTVLVHEKPVELDLGELRRRLIRRSAGVFPVYGDEGAGRAAAPATPASVLVPLVAHPRELTVLFTQRTTQLRNHSGQVSFPGGRAEPHDPTPEFTALREAQEEIGLPTERIEVLARLPDYFTRTGFRVTPVVGLLEPPLLLRPDPREVDEVFEVPLAFLLDPKNHERRTREWQGRSVGYYVMQYESRVIWGATAAMLVNLYRQLAGAPAQAV